MQLDHQFLGREKPTLNLPYLVRVGQLWDLHDRREHLLHERSPFRRAVERPYQFREMVKDFGLFSSVRGPILRSHTGHTHLVQLADDEHQEPRVCPAVRDQTLDEVDDPRVQLPSFGEHVENLQHERFGTFGILLEIAQEPGVVRTDGVNRSDEEFLDCLLYGWIHLRVGVKEPGERFFNRPGKRRENAARTAQEKKDLSQTRQANLQGIA